MKNNHSTYIRLLFGLLVMVMSGLTAAAQNTLRVDDFTAAAGKEASVPVYLENSTAIVGMQFDITLPYAKASGDVTLVSSRSNGHTVSLRRLSEKRYTVVVMSLHNQPLKGNAGLLLRFPIQVADDAQNGDELPVSLENIVLTDISGRNQAAASTSTATFTVLSTPSPDFTPQQLTVLNSDGDLTPGGKLRLSFSVLNQGSAESRDGWTEKVYLEDATGQRVFVATQTYPNTLAAGATLPRTYEVDLPQVLRMEGAVQAVVELTALKSTDEQVADQGNNSTTSANTLTLAKRLFLSEERILLEEGASRRITLTRSGDWSMDETFTLTDESGMLSLPATVTIAARQSAAVFTVGAIDNSEVNPQLRTYVVGRGDDYPDVQMTVDVADNDNYPLTLTLDKARYTEGEAVVLTVTIGSALDTDLKVDIVNTATARFYPFVRSITIPAGQLSAQATTQVVDDHYPMADAAVTFTASATGYDTSRRNVALTDDDWPRLTLTLQPAIISEGAGYGATQATITRDGSTAENLNVYVSANAGAELYFDSNRNTIPAGQSSITVPIGVEDNAVIDGERQWTVSVAAMDAQTGQPAGQGSLSYATALLTVTDDDTDRTLKLTTTQATLTEGGSAVTVTIERNTTEGQCVVSLSSDDEQLQLPQSVTISAGQRQTTFSVSAKANLTEDDNHYASVTARAEGYQSASFAFLVTDETHPRPVAGVITPADAQPYAGGTLHITLPLSNQGTATQPAGLGLQLYLCDHNYITDRSVEMGAVKYTPIAELTTTKAVAAGQTVDMDFDVQLPLQPVGQYYLFALPMPVTSLSAQGMPALSIQAPFTATTLTTDRQQYSRGETVVVSGRMSNEASGVSMDGQQAEVFLVNGNGELATYPVTLSADGTFTADISVTQQMGGGYGVGVRCKSDELQTTQAHIDVYALAFDSGYRKMTLAEGVTEEGDIMVTNLSESTLSDISFAFTTLPREWQVTVDRIATLKGGATASVHYTIVPTTPSPSQKYTRGAFTATVRGAGGLPVATASMTVDHYCYAARAQLTTDADQGIKTTISRQSQRQWLLTLRNTGMLETGIIAVEWPTEQPWLKAQATQLPSLKVNEKATLTLELNGQEDMVVDGTYESFVKLRPQNGSAIVVPVRVTVVSTDLTKLTIDVVDSYTLVDNGPHVADATVRLTNALTGEVAMTGTTGSDGLYTTDILKEGTYYVYVTAPNHNYAEKTITVSPGEENTLQVYVEYKAVNISYTVERTTVTDEYVTVLTMDVVPDIPQAIVVPDLPNWGCGLNTFSVKLTNKGRLTAYTPYLEFPVIDGCTFTVKSEYPQVIYPNESYDVAIEYSGPEQMRETFAGFVCHYGYKIQGEMHHGKDTYGALVGCSDTPIILPGGGLGGSEQRNYGENESDIPTLANVGEEEDETGTTQMPTVAVRDYTQTSHNVVTLQFEQRFFLEREAFRGHLTVENAQMNGIEDIILVPSVKRTSDGQDATDLFAISQDGTGAWRGIDAWSLGANETGQAEVLYVPSKETAPTEPVDYLFGGTLTYRDVETGQIVTVELMQTQLSVNPSPDLHLMYFVQRDFLSDDPVTEDYVEPWEPAEFALLIQNRGAGDAIDLRIETSEPTVVSNENNLPVEFTSLYSTVDGMPGAMSFRKLNLGRIAAQSSVMARWWFYSNVTAHVAYYDVQMTKHSNYGIEFDLITLDGVRELTHSVSGQLARHPMAGSRRRAPQMNTQANIFLLNDIEDEDNLPDHLIDSQGNETDDLEMVSQSMQLTEGPEAGQYLLHVSATRQGWVYGRMTDPTNCTMQLVKAIRQSDGQDVTGNLWQTDRTVQADYSVLSESRLHLADNIRLSEDYLLFYAPKPAPAPQVRSITLVTDDDTDEAHALQAKVEFAEPVDMSTVSADDMVMVEGGRAVRLTVTPQDDTHVLVEWSEQPLLGGQAILTVYTSAISNTEGTTGTHSKSSTWTAASNIGPGDANGDGRVTIADAAAIVQHIIRKPQAVFVLNVADMNGDGAIDMKDALRIVDIVLGR